MVDIDHVNTAKTELPAQIFFGCKPKCDRDTDLRQLDHSAHNARHTEKSAEKVSVFQYDIRNTLSSDDLYRSVQVSERPRFNIGGDYHKINRSIKFFRPLRFSVLKIETKSSNIGQCQGIFYYFNFYRTKN